MTQAASCPRCGSAQVAPGEVLCRTCREALLAGGAKDTMKIDLVPILRDALTTAGPGEDFDEALLRALKRTQPEHSAALLPALTRVLGTEAQRTGEDKRAVAQRMADDQRVPDLTFSSNLGRPKVVRETRITTSEGKTYHSLEELPPHLRRSLKSQLSRREKPKVKMGCSSWLLGGPLLCLLRALWR
jgi:hypothetical protein